MAQLCTDNDGERDAMLILIAHMAKEKFTLKARLYLLGMTAGVVNAVMALIISLKPCTVGVPLGSCNRAMAFSIHPFRALVDCNAFPRTGTHLCDKKACRARRSASETYTRANRQHVTMTSQKEACMHTFHVFCIRVCTCTISIRLLILRVVGHVSLLTVSEAQGIPQVT
jgi:hypothetical protein